MADLSSRRASKPRTAQTCWNCPGSDVENQLPPGQITGDRKVAGEKNKDDEKEDYKKLMEILEQVEDKRANEFKVAAEIIVVLGLTVALTCTLNLDRIKHKRLLGLRMWQYVTMAIALFAGLSIIRFFTWLVLKMILISWKLKLHRDLGYFLRMMKTGIDVTLWLCFILFAWYLWFRPRLNHVSVVAAHQVTSFLITACLGSGLWVGKNALFLWLKAGLHYRQLCDRITRTICQLHILQILHNFGVWRFLTRLSKGEMETLHHLLETRPYSKEVKDLQMKGFNICKQLPSVKRENVPVWILKRLREEYLKQTVRKPLPVTKEIIQNPDRLMEQARNLFRQMKKANHQPDQYDSTHGPSDWDDDVVKVADLKERYEVTDEDLKFFFRKFPKASRQDSYHGGRGTHNVSQQDDSITEDDFCSWAVVAYRNCWGLQSTLKSSEQIILKLNRMMTAFVLILSLIIWLLLSDIVDSAQIALLFSPLLAAKFIFSETTKNMFDGLVFALAMHPFNSGDRVIIQEMELLVTETNILTTTFYKYKTGEELVIPNSELATTRIINLESIPDQSDELEFIISKDTPPEDIKDLEVKIQMSLNETKDAFNTKVVMKEMGLEDIKMVAHFKYVGSYLTSEVKAVHKSDMLSVIMRLHKEMVENSTEVLPEVKKHIYKITLNKRAKLEQTKTMKETIERFMKKFYGGYYEFKVVLDDVIDQHVWINFYVWTKSSDTTNEEIIQQIMVSDIRELLEKDYGKCQIEAEEINKARRL